MTSLLIRADQAPHGSVIPRFWEIWFSSVPATNVLYGGLMASYPTHTNNPFVLGTQSMPQKCESVLSKVPCGGHCSAGAPSLVINGLSPPCEISVCFSDRPAVPKILSSFVVPLLKAFLSQCWVYFPTIFRN